MLLNLSLLDIHINTQYFSSLLNFISSGYLRHFKMMIDFQ